MGTVVLKVCYTHSHMNHKGNVREVQSTAYIVVTPEEAAGISGEAGYRWVAELLSKKDIFSPFVTQITAMTAKDMDMKLLKEIY